MQDRRPRIKTRKKVIPKPSANFGTLYNGPPNLLNFECFLSKIIALSMCAEAKYKHATCSRGTDELPF
jgi:hypothetical protein